MEKLKKFALPGLVLLLLYFLFRPRTAQQILTADPNARFYEPYYYTNPGIPDDYDILNGGEPFVSNVTVNVSNPAFGSLNNQYIPIFGLVGMTGVKG